MMPETALQAASLLRRLASMLYEALLLAAVMYFAGFVFVAATHNAQTPGMRHLLQAYLLAVSACYFLWFWLHGGQTLAMKTWRLKLVSADGRRPTPNQCALRFIAAMLGIGLAGAGILWALVDRERQFLHDRLAGTRLIFFPATT